MKILCPIDFSPASSHALRMATALAKARSCPLVILHTWHMPALYYSELAYPSNVTEEMIEGSEAELSAAMDEAKAAGVENVSTLLLAGIPADTIIGALEEDAAFDLVVLGANGRGGLARVLMGSVAEKITRGAPCSVLAVHATHRIAPFARILCPTDFSECSSSALDVALDLAVPGGTVTLLNVLETTTNYAGDSALGDFLSSVDQRSSAELDTLIAASSQKAKRGDVTLSKSTRIGNAGRQILTLLESEPRFDLVAMGTHGRTGLRRLVLGSIAEKVVRHAPCPVLVARKRASATVG